MWAQNNLWACVGIFVSGLMKLRSENLYLNTPLAISLAFLLLLLFFPNINPTTKIKQWAYESPNIYQKFIKPIIFI